MSTRYTGGLITKNPQPLDPARGNAANGVFTMDQYMQAVQDGTWPGFDPYFEYTTLLLHGNGTNGAQNNTFLDSSTNNFTITRNGNTTQGTFSPFSKPDGRWGALTRDRAYISIPASSDFDIISTDYTIEFWWKLNAFNTMSSSGNNFFGNALATASNGWAVGFAGSGSTVTQIQFITWAAGVRTNNYFTVSISTIMSEWCHIAIVRSGSGAGNLKCYVNGVAQGAAQNAGTYSTAGSTFTCGSGSYTQNGNYSGNADYYISNIRLTKSAIYTSDFTPSNTPLTAISGTTLLLFQDNRFINNGTNAGAITSSGYTATRTAVTPFSPFPITTAYDPSVNGGSGYFDGSGDYLEMSDNASFQFGANNWTVEFWAYATSALTTNYIISQFSTGNKGIIFGTGAQVSGKISYLVSTTGSNDIPVNDPDTFPINQWVHVAGVRTGDLLALFVNGTRKGTYSLSAGASLYNSTNLIRICAHSDGSASTFFPGYISNLRSVIGANSPYDATQSTITIPTAPLTAITNTSFLCNFTNAGILDNTGFNNLETVGNAQIDTSVVKYGTGSMEFDGTGDYLRVRNDPSFDFLASNWTIEFWLYKVNNSTAILITKRPNNTTPGVPHIFANTSNQIRVELSGTDFTTSSSFTLNAWNHIAIVRNGSGSNNVKCYINGTADANSGTSSSVPSNAYDLIIGGDTNAQFLNGYIDDLRITKGIARYTTTFTPPTSQVQDV